jgi:hypothetical protein
MTVKVQKNWLGKGILFCARYDSSGPFGPHSSPTDTGADPPNFPVRSTLHVLRIDNTTKQNQFIIDSVIGAPENDPDPNTHVNVQYFYKTNVVTLKDTIINKTRPNPNPKSANPLLRPVYLTNGMMFADDCRDRHTDQPIVKSALSSNCYSNGIQVAKQDPYFGVKNRWHFTQFIDPGNSKTPYVSYFDFGRGDGLPPNPTSTSKLYTFLGGAAPLVSGGSPVGSKRSDWTQKALGSFSSEQNFCAGPIIASNYKQTVIYIINDISFTNTNAYLVANYGRRYDQMAPYISSGQLLNDVHLGNDDPIDSAVCFDGGGSRGLWISGGDRLFNFAAVDNGIEPDLPYSTHYGLPVLNTDGLIFGYNNCMMVPHFITVYGEPPPLNQVMPN